MSKATAFFFFFWVKQRGFAIVELGWYQNYFTDYRPDFNFEKKKLFQFSIFFLLNGKR
jgi:hypothetical protein